MNIASAIAFDTAEREYNDAWNAPSSTRFELSPVDVNKVLKERYRVSPGQTLTAPPGSAGRHCSADGSRRRKDASLRMSSSAMPSRPSSSWDGPSWLKQAARLLQR